MDTGTGAGADANDLDRLLSEPRSRACPSDSDSASERDAVSHARSRQRAPAALDSLDPLDPFSLGDRSPPRYPRETSASQRATASPPQRHSHRSLDPIKDTRVFVGNIPWETTWQDLKDLMRPIGNIAHADIIKNDGRSKGCGIVEFNSPADAQRAIREFHNKTFMGRPLIVREDRSYESRHGRAPPPLRNGQDGPSSGFSLDRDRGRGYDNDRGRDSLRHRENDRLRDRDSYHPRDRERSPDFNRGRDRDYGRDRDSSRDRDYGRERDFGRDRDFGHDRDYGRDKGRSPPPARPPSGQESKIFVGNLPFSTTSADLRELFKRAAPVLRADVIQGPDGRSRGAATVSFESPFQAQAAISMFDGHEVRGRKMEVREDRRRPLALGRPASSHIASGANDVSSGWRQDGDPDNSMQGIQSHGPMNSQRFGGSGGGSGNGGASGSGSGGVANFDSRELYSGTMAGGGDGVVLPQGMNPAMAMAAAMAAAAAGFTGGNAGGGGGGGGGSGGQGNMQMNPAAMAAFGAYLNAASGNNDGYAGNGGASVE